MADWRSMFDREYIGAWDLGDKDVIVTIVKAQGVELKMQGGIKNKKPVIWFDGKEKGMVLNKTNSKTIAALYGNDTANWIGKPISIYATRTTFGSEEVDCIRVRPAAPIKGVKSGAA